MVCGGWQYSNIRFRDNFDGGELDFLSEQIIKNKKLFYSPSTCFYTPLASISKWNAGGNVVAIFEPFLLLILRV